MRPSEPMLRGSGDKPTDPSLLASPLDFISEDHLRERAICAMLDRAATMEVADPDEAAHAAGFLADELPVHLADEEDDLFPLLRRRCTPEDDIDRALDRLQADHRHADFDTPRVAALLREAAGGSVLDMAARARLARFATHARRHLIFENAIVLPFARSRLTPKDLRGLGRAMRRRRGLDALVEKAHAE
jgi:hemerythrin-like domain-containing protein